MIRDGSTGETHELSLAHLMKGPCFVQVLMTWSDSQVTKSSPYPSHLTLKTGVYKILEYVKIYSKDEIKYLAIKLLLEYGNGAL
jgi:hypothetical protein